jgi:hypothetical protein
MLGFGDNHCICAKPLFRPERVTDLYLRCCGLWQFRERVDQLFDGCGLQNLHNSDFGHGLLSLACTAAFTDINDSLKQTTNSVGRTHDRRQGQNKVQQVLDDVSRTGAAGSQRLSDAMPALS